MICDDGRESMKISKFAGFEDSNGIWISEEIVRIPN